MPTISIFFGIAIRMFFSDHPPPHFHVAYQRYRAVIAIESGAIISGALPPAVHRPEHDPEKWKPVFRKDHAPLKC
jgi:hypothetical protein